MVFDDPAVALGTAEGVKTPPTGILARQADATVEASEADLGASGLMVAFPAKLREEEEMEARYVRGRIGGRKETTRRDEGGKTHSQA